MVVFDIAETQQPQPQSQAYESDIQYQVSTRTQRSEAVSRGVKRSFIVTAYCHCVKCCGKSDGITATGTKVEANRTIAVDPLIIPLGSKVEVEGLGVFVAEDTGGAIKGNRIDVYFSTHEEALQFGKKTLKVRIV